MYDFQAGLSPNAAVTAYQRNGTPQHNTRWEHVVLEKDPATMVAPDVANLGQAPRQLTPALKAYLRNNAPRWDLLFAIIAIPAPVIFIIGVASVHMSVGTIATNLFYTLAFCAFGWWARTRNAALRDALEATLTFGQLRFARLIENRQHVYRRGGQSYYRYDAVFQIDGRNVAFRSYNTGMAMVDRGQLVEVIYNRAYPDMILPTFLLV